MESPLDSPGNEQTGREGGSLSMNSTMKIMQSQQRESSELVARQLMSTELWAQNNETPCGGFQEHCLPPRHCAIHPLTPVIHSPLENPIPTLAGPLHNLG
jgi:hypothetical protein